MRLRIPERGKPESGNKITLSRKRRREFILYGLGAALFLAVLTFIVREHDSPSDGG